MPDQLEDLFDEYDSLTADVARSRYEFFTTSLKRWFSFLDSASQFARIVLQQLDAGIEFKPWYQRCAQTGGSMVGSAKLDWPSDSRKYLGLRLALCRAFAQGDISLYDFASTFLYRENDFDVMASDVISQIFTPMSGELRRYLKRELARQISEVTYVAPASDRVVRLDHNSAEYRDASDALARVERAVQEANDYEDAEDKEQRVAELSAGQRLLQSARVRVDAVVTVLKPTLTYLTRQFADKAIGILAGAALLALARLLGLV